MVINLGHVKNGDYDKVRKEIREIVKNLKITLKVIIETCLLSGEEKVVVSKIIAEEGANFVKTSTGFNYSGAKVEDIKLIKSTIASASSKCGVKASGGIKSYSFSWNKILFYV